MTQKGKSLEDILKVLQERTKELNCLYAIEEILNENNIELDYDQKVLEFVLTAIHEHGEKMHGYSHCDEPHCPMYADPIIFIDPEMEFQTRPCSKHRNLEKYMVMLKNLNYL